MTDNVIVGELMPLVFSGNKLADNVVLGVAATIFDNRPQVLPELPPTLLGKLRRFLISQYTRTPFVQLLFVYIQWRTIPDPNQVSTDGYAIYLPIMLLCDSLPLVLWAIIAHDFVREKTTRIFDSIEPKSG